MKPLNEGCIVAYRDTMSHLARRFFHHLLRFNRFDKAYLLAVDIGARDLFMDIHYIAKDKGEHALADVAIKKASQMEADLIGSDRLVDEDDYSENEEDADSIEEFYHSTDDEDEITTQMAPCNMNHTAVGHALESAVRNNEVITSSNTTQQTYMNLSEISLRELEASLANQMIDDYSRKLMEEQPVFSLAAAAASNQQQDDDDTQAYTPASVRVIHFGMV